MTTHRKTAKGLAELSTRANKLSPKHRAALILVDGRRTDEELNSMIPHEAEATLRWLSESGFIEVDGHSANASHWSVSESGERRAATHAAPKTPTRVEPPPASRKAIPQIQRESVRELLELVGPMAESLCLKIEKSRSREELRSLLEVAFLMLSNTRGRATAEAFQGAHIEGL